MATYKYRGIISTFSSVASSLKEAKLCYGEEEGQEFRIIDNMPNEWGDIYPMNIVSKESFLLPCKIKLRWITLVDLKCYELKATLDTVKIEEMWAEQEKQFPVEPFKYIVVGIGPYGEVTLWLRSSVNAVVFQRLKANEVEFNDFERPIYSGMGKDDETMKRILSEEKIESLMRQYTYRYVPLEEYFDGKEWRKYTNEDDFYEEIDIVCVEDKRTDGTFDFSDSDSLYKYHTTGMPKRISVRWREFDAEFFAHFWLDIHYVNWFFESLQKSFPDTPADILIRLDTNSSRFEVAMTAEDLIPRTFIGTQYIVFRNNEEISRSEHFSKSDKDWDW